MLLYWGPSTSGGHALLSAREGEAAGMADLKIDPLSNVRLFPLEDRDLIAPRPPGEPSRVGLARAFTKNLHDSPNQTFARAARSSVDYLEQILIARFLHPLFDLILHFSCRCFAARRVAKNERVVELNSLHQLARFFVILIRFARETDDHVGR